MLLKIDSKGIDELERIKNLKSDNSFEKANLLKELAIRFSEEGKNEECAEALKLASEEILKAAVAEEKPRELCKIARLYSEIGRPDKAEETIQKALTILENVRKDNPWKFTNYLCYAAYEMLHLGRQESQVRETLSRAITFLGNIDAYYLRRKGEVLSLLKRFSGDKRLLPHLEFSPETAIPANTRPETPFEQDFDYLYSHIFLSHEEIDDLKSLAEKNAGKKEVSRVVSGIDERWRQAVALAILSKLFVEKGNVKKASEMLCISLKRAREVPYYWVRDNALEVISGTYLEIYNKNNAAALLDDAKNAISQMKDPWKRARAFCRIAETHIKEKRFEQAAQEINHVHSHLLGKIDYRDRTAMSMLLIAEVFDKMNKKRATNPFSIFNPDRRRANRLRRDAFSILDSYGQDKRKESLDEYKRFISLKGRSWPGLNQRLGDKEIIKL